VPGLLLRICLEFRIGCGIGEKDVRSICTPPRLDERLSSCSIKVFELEVTCMESRAGFDTCADSEYTRFVHVCKSLPLNTRKNAVPTPGIEFKGRDTTYRMRPSFDNRSSGFVSDLPRTLKPDEFD